MLDARALGVFSESGNKSVLYLFFKMLSVYYEIFRFVFSCVSHAKNSCCIWGGKITRDMKDMTVFILTIFYVLFEHFHSNLKVNIKEYVRSSAKAS